MTGNKTSRESKGLSRKDRRIAEERAGLKAPIIYESIRQEGEHELSRPFSALWWSGVAAGLGISTAIICKGFLYGALPDTVWRPVITNIGYAIGFIIVILGRLQLFTENTITVILPLLQHFTSANLLRIARLWSIVFVANMTGCFVAALLIAHGGILTPPNLAAVLELSSHYAEATPLQHFLWGAPAGFMIAVLVWIIPSLEDGGEILAILLITWMIGLGGMSHVVAGATELFVVMLTGGITPSHAIFGGIVPALVGNILGGTGVFALLTFAQVREEM